MRVKEVHCSTGMNSLACHTRTQRSIAMKNHRSIHLSVIFLLATLLSLMAAQPQALSQSLPKRLLVTQAIDEGARVTLAGNTHPEANKENDRGPVAGDFPMEHLMLLLRR